MMRFAHVTNQRPILIYESSGPVNSSPLEPPIPVRQTQSVFHPYAQQIAYRRRDARQQQKLFGRWSQSLRRSPAPTGFAEIVSDDLPVFHARRNCASFALTSSPA